MSYDIGIPSVPFELREQVERELDEGERLEWIGQPVPRFFDAQSTSAFLFAIPWTAFAVFWMFGAAGFKIPNFQGPQSYFCLFGLPFVLTGCWMLSRPLITRRNMKQTVYAVTDRRVLIFVPHMFSTAVRSFEPEDLDGIQRRERRGGIGDLLFGAHGAADATTIPDGFFNIREVREVEQSMRRLRRVAGKKKATEEE